MAGRSGTYRINFSGDAAYKSFVPTALPPIPPVRQDAEIVDLLIKANREIAILEAISSRIPDIRLFLAMYVRKEALMSSQIEGTQATLEDVLDPSNRENANRDVTEVINYIKAVEYAIKRMETLPLCARLLRETHAVLMKGARGRNKAPGEFRRTQNWLGGQGSTIKTARYIPPHPEDMTRAMAELETYLNAEDNTDPLIRAALVHYQFETIHPFLDGNGRIGRLLITLFLMRWKILSTPALYISYFLKKNRTEYYDRMTMVRSRGGYEQWVQFFLEAVYESAFDAVAATDKLTALHEMNIEIVSGFGRAAKTAVRLFSYLEENPIIDIQKTAAALHTTFRTIALTVEKMCAAGILSQHSGARRNRTFSYEAYLAILKEGT